MSRNLDQVSGGTTKKIRRLHRRIGAFFMEAASLKALLEAGCHFGHKSDRWHPKAQQFIYQERDGIHIIDLVKTKTGLEAAANFLYDLGKEGKTVLFVGTKRQAAAVIAEEAARVGASFLVERWIGGFLTNWEQIHANLEKIRRLKEEETTGGWKKYPKHERVKLGRYVRKLERLYGGVLELRTPPDALMIVDIKRENVAVQEAHRVEAPIVGVVDTNSDPTGIHYPIPANDDAVGSISYLVHFIAEAYREGKEAFEKEAAKAANAEERQEIKVAEKIDEVQKVEKENVEEKKTPVYEEKPKKKTKAKKE